MLQCRMCRRLVQEFHSKSEKLCSPECAETYERLATERGGYHVLERDLQIIELKKMCADLLVQNQDLRSSYERTHIRIAALTSDARS